jgi:peptidoglycan/LPS O-acetylase OafA/YrhL
VIQARRFLIRRGLKIWPAFYFLLLVHTIVRSHPIETFLWQNAFHVQNYFGTTIRQTWSLAIEEHFYLALTILLAWAAAKRFGPRRLLAIMAGICLIAGGIRVATVMAGNLDGAFRWTQNRLDSLMFGVIIATLFHLKRDIYDGIARQKLALIVISAAGFAFLWFANGDPALMRTSGYTLIYLSFGAFLILVYEHSGKMGEWLLYRGIAWVGIYSYGIYLWHTITLAPARKLAAHIPTDLQWIVLILFQFTLSVAVGVVLTHLVEWPFLRWRERHMGKQENPAHTATGPLIAKTG